MSAHAQATGQYALWPPLVLQLPDSSWTVHQFDDAGRLIASVSNQPTREAARAAVSGRFC